MKRLVLIAPIAALAVAGCGSSSSSPNSASNITKSTPTASATPAAGPAGSPVQKDTVSLNEFTIDVASPRV